MANEFRIKQGLIVADLTYPNQDGTTGQVIITDGSGNLSLSDLDASNVTGLATVATSGSYNDLANQPNIPINIGDLSDVNTTGAINGSVLKFDGSNWIVGTDNAGMAGGGATEERFRLNYATNGQLASIDNTTSGIASTNILSPTGGNVEITFTGHAYPPSSVIIYGYAHASNQYLIRTVDANLATRTIDAGGTSGSPTAFGSFTGPMTLTLREAETGASRDFGTTTEAWVMFVFGD